MPILRQRLWSCLLLNLPLSHHIPKPQTADGSKQYVPAIDRTLTTCAGEVKWYNNNMGNTLVKDKKFGGRYIALRDFGDEKVVADGKDANEAIRKAGQKGLKNPVILFVSEKDMVHIY